MRPIIRSSAAAQVDAVLLLIGPLVASAAELITAAWPQPHYSPFYNWVSHLGLIGPSRVAFGPAGNSALGEVMDTGWVLYVPATRAMNRFPKSIPCRGSSQMVMVRA